MMMIMIMMIMMIIAYAGLNEGLPWVYFRMQLKELTAISKLL